MRFSRKMAGCLFGLILTSGSSFQLIAADNPWFVELGFNLSEVDSPLDLSSSPAFYWPGDTWIGVPTGPVTVHPPSGFETDEGLTFTLGHRFGDNWGVEVGYLDFGDFGSKSTFTAGSTPYISQQTQVNIDGLNLALFGEIPITDRWAVRGKVGVFAYDSDSGFVVRTTQAMYQGVRCDVVNDPDGCYNPFFVTGRTPDVFRPTVVVTSTNYGRTLPASDGGQRISFSVGGSYQLSERYAINFDYSLFNDIDSNDIEMLKLGLSYSF